MRKYILKRLGISVIILLCVTFVIYALIRSLPSSYVENMAMQLSAAPGAKPYQEWVDQLNKQYGLDKNILMGYLTWFKDAVRGHFGNETVFPHRLYYFRHRFSRYFSSVLLLRGAIETAVQRQVGLVRLIWLCRTGLCDFECCRKVL